jgi:hypothetical protein
MVMLQALAAHHPTTYAVDAIRLHLLALLEMLL